MITIRQLMQKIGELSPLSPTAPKLAQAVADPESTVENIVRVLQYDQALTLDVLKYANSSMSASSRTIATVKDAVIRLGGARILEWVVARHIRTTLQVPLVTYGYSEKDLWRHSVAAASAAEQLGHITHSAFAGLSFTAALLHDIGKLIIGRAADSADMNALFHSATTGVTFEQRERAVFGFSHTDIGAEIAASWQLPGAIVEAIRYHHSLDHTGEPVTDAVRISNIVARTIGEGIGDEGMSLSVDAGLAQRTGVSHEQFELLCARAGSRFTAVLSMFEM